MLIGSFFWLLGGPLHSTVNGRTTIVGIGSFSNQTIIDDADYLLHCNGQAWYSHVGYHMDWIESFVGKDHC